MGVVLTAAAAAAAAGVLAGAARGRVRTRVGGKRGRVCAGSGHRCVRQTSLSPAAAAGAPPSERAAASAATTAGGAVTAIIGQSHTGRRRPPGLPLVWERFVGLDRDQAGNLKLLVRWRGYAAEEDTLEPGHKFGRTKVTQYCLQVGTKSPIQEEQAVVLLEPLKSIHAVWPWCLVLGRQGPHQLGHPRPNVDQGVKTSGDSRTLTSRLQLANGAPVKAADVATDNTLGADTAHDVPGVVMEQSPLQDRHYRMVSVPNVL